MTDEEFLNYCTAHCRTERAGFVPSNISRLLRLAGKPEMAAHWDKANPQMIRSIYEDEIDPLVAEAFKRMEPDND